MITREQFIAGFDQELASVRDRINGMVATYASNMKHVAECDKCTEVDNITQLIMCLFENIGNAPQSLVAYLAVAVKLLHDQQNGINGDLP